MVVILETDNLEISHKALLLLGQVKQLLTEVGCKRPVLELAVIFDIILQDANWPTLHSKIDCFNPKRRRSV